MSFDFVANVMLLIPMVLSLTVHEWAHAFSAYKLGDDTALREGRLTLNPVPHIDPIGTLLLPLLGVPFGWAKPVPVNPARFRRDVHMGTGMAITAAAGPLSNLVLAAICTFGLALVVRSDPRGVADSAIFQLLSFGLQLNVALFVFNLLPIYPLDGSRILERFIPFSFRDQWETVKRFSPFVMMALMVGGRGLIGAVLAGPQRAITAFLISVFAPLAG